MLVVCFIAIYLYINAAFYLLLSKYTTIRSLKDFFRLERGSMVMINFTLLIILRMMYFIHTIT